MALEARGSLIQTGRMKGPTHLQSEQRGRRASPAGLKREAHAVPTGQSLESGSLHVGQLELRASDRSTAIWRNTWNPSHG